MMKKEMDEGGTGDDCWGPERARCAPPPRADEGGLWRRNFALTSLGPPDSTHPHPLGCEWGLVLAVGKFVVDVAQLVPLMRRMDRIVRGPEDVFSENDCHTGFQVGIEVAVEEPRTRVVRFEPNCDVVVHTTRTDGVAPHRVLVVGLVLARAAHHSKHVL